jgi:hypothetical protein
MPTTDDVPSKSYRRARGGLVALLLLSLGPPLLYYRAVVPGFDSARLPTGMLPGPFVFLQLLGFFSAFLPPIFFISLALSLFRPRLSTQLFRRCTAVLLLFNVCYLCYALFLIAVVLIIRAP